MVVVEHNWFVEALANGIVALLVYWFLKDKIREMIKEAVREVFAETLEPKRATWKDAARRARVQEPRFSDTHPHDSRAGALAPRDSTG